MALAILVCGSARCLAAHWVRHEGAGCGVSECTSAADPANGCAGTELRYCADSNGRPASAPDCCSVRGGLVTTQVGATTYQDEGCGFGHVRDEGDGSTE